MTLLLAGGAFLAGVLTGHTVVSFVKSEFQKLAALVKKDNLVTAFKRK